MVYLNFYLKEKRPKDPWSNFHCLLISSFISSGVQRALCCTNLLNHPLNPPEAQHTGPDCELPAESLGFCMFCKRKKICGASVRSFPVHRAEVPALRPNVEGQSSSGGNTKRSSTTLTPNPPFLHKSKFYDSF